MYIHNGEAETRLAEGERVTFVSLQLLPLLMKDEQRERESQKAVLCVSLPSSVKRKTENLQTEPQILTELLNRQKKKEIAKFLSEGLFYNALTLYPIIHLKNV